MVKNTWFVGQTLPVTFNHSRAFCVVHLLDARDELLKVYKRWWLFRGKKWEAKHQRALDRYNEALRVLEHALSDSPVWYRYKE